MPLSDEPSKPLPYPCRQLPSHASQYIFNQRYKAKHDTFLQPPPTIIPTITRMVLSPQPHRLHALAAPWHQFTKAFVQDPAILCRTPLNPPEPTSTPPPLPLSPPPPIYAPLSPPTSPFILCSVPPTPPPSPKHFRSLHYPTVPKLVDFSAIYRTRKATKYNVEICTKGGCARPNRECFIWETSAQDVVTGDCMEKVAIEFFQTGKIPAKAPPTPRPQTLTHEVSASKDGSSTDFNISLGGSWRWFLEDSAFWVLKHVVVKWDEEDTTFFGYIIARLLNDCGSDLVVVRNGICERLMPIHNLRYCEKPAAGVWATPVAGLHCGAVAKQLIIKRKNREWMRFGNNKIKKNPLVPKVTPEEHALFVEVYRSY